MRKVLRKIKNYILGVLTLLAIATVYMSIAGIEQGHYIAVVPFGISLFYLWCFTYANGMQV